MKKIMTPNELVLGLLKAPDGTMCDVRQGINGNIYVRMYVPEERMAEISAAYDDKFLTAMGIRQ